MRVAHRDGRAGPNCRPVDAHGCGVAHLAVRGATGAHGRHDPAEDHTTAAGAAHDQGATEPRA